MVDDRVTVRPAWMIRAVIVTALVGHGLANALFDAAEYAGESPALIARLNHPFLVQSALGLLVVALLSLRRDRAKRTLAARRLPLTALLVGLQLVLFVGLETSERIAVDLFAGGATEVDAFGVGFVAELLVAVGSALILAVLAETAKRWLEVGSSIERPAVGLAFPIALAFVPTRGSLSGAGSVRAPPSRSPVRSS